MSHHGWVPVIDAQAVTPSGLKSPFGRLFPAADHTYDSLAVSLLAGARGPMESPEDSDGTLATTRKNGIPRGFTFFGQFIDHDLTEFRVVAEDQRLVLSNPTIGQRQRVLEDGRLTCTNGRIPSLDLDCVYGVLGVTQPNLFDGRGLFRLKGRDIERSRLFQNDRLIADPRNDENKLITQIHVLFERLHNKIHKPKIGRQPTGVGSTAFDETRAQVVEIYRRIVLCDYLPRIVQKSHIALVIDALQGGKTFYQAMTARAAAAFTRGFPDVALPADFLAMPVEFAHAAFRLGHSQLRSTYRLNASNGFPLFAVDQSATQAPDGSWIKVDDLRGNQALCAKFQVDWAFFFPPEPARTDLGEPLDAKLTAALFRLPPPAIGEPPTSLAERNIRRGVDFGLPSGQEAASHLASVYGDLKTIDPEQLFPEEDFQARYAEILEREPRLAWATPLWYYILREAGAHTSGTELGPVGGLIVAETILGSLAARAVSHRPDAPDFDLAATWDKCGGGKPSDAAPSPQTIATMRQLVSFLADDGTAA